MGSVRSWWSGTKPTDVLSVLFSLVSLGFAYWALRESERTTERQAEFQERTEEQSAPVLAPGTPPDTRGKTVRVSTEYARVEKRADRLLLDRADRRLVIPLRNGGAGIALTVGVPVLVDDCRREPNVLPAQTVGLLGTYLIPSGGSDQLGFLQPRRARPGSVAVGNRRLRYSWDYRNFGRRGVPRNLLVWYTDGARHRLRWTCIRYQVAKRSRDGSQYAVEGHLYGTRDWPAGSQQAP